MSVEKAADFGKLFGEAADEAVTDKTLRFPHDLEELGPGLPDHELLRFIGCGGMGAGVFLARERANGEEVALKILPDEVAADLRVTNRFEREAAAMESLDHENILTIRGFGRSLKDDLFIVMDYVDGETLEQRLSHGALEISLTRHFFEQTCSALECAHQTGIIHRDIKPANILIDSNDCVRVSDFGLAKWYGTGHTMSQSSVAGTYGYIAPELLTGTMRVGPQTDVYSMGVVLYQMLTGTLPVGAYKSVSSINPEAAGLDQVIEKALNPQPEERYESIADFAQAVDTAFAQKARSPAGAFLRRPHGWAAVALALVCVSGFVGWKQRSPWSEAWERFHSLGESLYQPGEVSLSWEQPSGNPLELRVDLREHEGERSYDYQLTNTGSERAFWGKPLEEAEVAALLNRFPASVVFQQLLQSLTITVTTDMDADESLTLSNSPWENTASRDRFLSAFALLQRFETQEALQVVTSLPTSDRHWLKASLPTIQNFAAYCTTADHVLLGDQSAHRWDGDWRQQALLKVAGYELLRPASSSPHALFAALEVAGVEVSEWTFRSRGAVVADAMTDSWLGEKPLQPELRRSLLEQLFAQDL